MKKSLFAFMVIAAFSFGFVACADLDGVNERIDKLESRVAALEQLNSDVDALKTLVTALQNNISVVSVTNTDDGYEILLSNNEKLTIRNGQDGQDGQDGATPAISVKADSDGIYYWAINGEFLLDGNGEKLRVSAAPAPIFKVEENVWYISYDQGATWTEIEGGDLSGNEPIFSGVVCGENSVQFILSNGDTFYVPLLKEFAIVADATAQVASGESVTVSYVITGAAAPVVYCIAEGGLSATVNATSATAGNVVITAGANAKSEGIVILFAESEDESIFKSIRVTVSNAISFTEPIADGYEVVFDHTKPIEATAINLAWKEREGAKFVLQIASSAEMTDPYTQDCTSASISFTNKELNHFVCSNMNGAYKTTTLYYRVVDENSIADPSEVKNIKFTTEFNSLLDPRDGEIYLITKVNGVEWLAENLRATKYSDGSAMPAATESEPDLACFFYEDGVYGKRAGAYYGYGNALGAHYSTATTRNGNLVTADEIVQGVCPTGWHMPNQNDWTDLMETAFKLANLTISPNFFTNATGAYARAAFQKMVLRSDVEEFFSESYLEANKAGFTNDLGLYFLPAGRYDSARAANSTTKPTGYGESFASWNATMKTIWQAWSPFIKYGDGQYYTISQKIHWTSGAAETLRCVKD